MPTSESKEVTLWTAPSVRSRGRAFRASTSFSLARSVSDVLPLSDAPKAVQRLRRKEGNPIRLVLQP